MLACIYASANWKVKKEKRFSRNLNRVRRTDSKSFGAFSETNKNLATFHCREDTRKFKMQIILS